MGSILNSLYLLSCQGLDIFCSTQAVNKTQMYCASAAGLPANQVKVNMKRMGGKIIIQ